MEYTIVRFSEAHIPALANLYNLCFKKNISSAWFRQKYDTEHTGAKYVGYLALHGHHVAAFYCVIPWWVQLEGRQILAAQSADTMTHPNHRNKGLFVALARKTYELAKNSGITFLFGFPNQHSQPGAVKLGWDFSLPPMKLFSLSLSLPYARVIFQSNLLSRAYLKFIRAILKSRTTNINDIFHEQHDGPLRNAAFVSYKRYSPAFFTTFAGAHLWIRLDGDMKIGYLDMPATLDPGHLLKKLKRLAFSLGCGRIVFITSFSSTLYKSLLPHLPATDAFPTGIFRLTEEKIAYELMTFEYCDLDIF